METEMELFGGRSGDPKPKKYPFYFLSATPRTPPPKIGRQGNFFGLGASG
jgi:hypothetical protein